MRTRENVLKRLESFRRAEILDVVGRVLFKLRDQPPFDVRPRSKGGACGVRGARAVREPTQSSWTVVDTFPLLLAAALRSLFQSSWPVVDTSPLLVSEWLAAAAALRSRTLACGAWKRSPRAREPTPDPMERRRAPWCRPRT
ncbi:uncharacterized protein LOC112349997 [Selaginella moellendorffii]|uniref:uncharacterized protein LOC112349997 n=1 Tax=Selaginella moellendorffii TaxID=88036 RepID=UPI000D1CB6E4|nr:uncharacterized protein LOC112349997 [Selaginella moellendorffii]|eukprot:XP_024541168.1 uncharacterized protein LOC112349997 [Selaginella moellendorffii]